MNAGASTQTTKRRISDLLDDLPLESLKVVEQFAHFLRREKLVKSKPPYPTVSAPISSLDAWTQLLPEGYPGDAVADTEALYDRV